MRGLTHLQVAADDSDFVGMALKCNVSQPTVGQTGLKEHDKGCDNHFEEQWA